jgi:hypothetical protein
MDRGPAADFNVPGVPTPIPNIGLTVQASRGPALVMCTVDIDHGGLGTSLNTVSILKNGVQLGSATQSLRMIGPDRMGASILELDPAPAVGDVYQIAISEAVVDPANFVRANSAVLVFVAVGKDAAFVSEVGAPTP